MAVLGVDACKAGWVGVRLDGSDDPSAFCAATIGELVDLAGDVDVVGIDIPIGLPKTGVRQADLLARAAVGSRRASVFMAPPRAVLEALTHEEATRLAVELTGKGISRQAYGLAPKVLTREGYPSKRGGRWHPQTVSRVLQRSAAWLGGSDAGQPAAG